MTAQGGKPLADLTVVELTVNVPGPFCAMMLADLGARVIKVEPPGGDPLRHNTGMWASLNRGKRSLVLDLKTAGGREVLTRLAKRADIVVEGWRPGVAQRLGADYPTLSEQNPGLIYCAISGFGQQGPWRDRPGHDINYLALSGYLDAEAAVGGRPWPPPVLISDLTSGLYAAISVLAALNGRQMSGRGAYVDLSMAEAAVSLLGLEIGRAPADGATDSRPNVTYIPHYGLFLCADGKWFSLGIVHEDHFWDRFCGIAGLTELVGLKFHERIARDEELRRVLRETFASKPSAEWERMLQESDVPAATVVELNEIFDSPQFMSRHTFVGLGLHTYVAQPARFSTGPVAPTQGPPGLDEHAEAILTEVGYSTVESGPSAQGKLFNAIEGPAAL